MEVTSVISRQRTSGLENLIKISCWSQLKQLCPRLNIYKFLPNHPGDGSNKCHLWNLDKALLQGTGYMFNESLQTGSPEDVFCRTVTSVMALWSSQQRIITNCKKNNYQLKKVYLKRCQNKIYLLCL